MNPKNPKKVDEEGLQLIKYWEQCSLLPYLDSAGIPTIGWGSTFYEDGQRVTLGDPPLTQQRADALFIRILSGFERVVFEMVNSLINQHQYNAIVSLCYNIGIDDFSSSAILKRVNQSPNDFLIHHLFLAFNKAWNPKTHRKEVLKGLTNRREMESKIYFRKP